MNFLPPIDNPGATSNNIRGGGGDMNISTQELTPVRGVKSQVENIDDMGATGSQIPDLNESNYPINFNFYAAKKTMAQGLMDIALLTANASQLKALLATDGKHQYYNFLITMTSISISLQILVAVIFLAVGRMDISVVKNQKILDVLNNVATAIVFIITVVNIFISAFGINDQQLMLA